MDLFFFCASNKCNCGEALLVWGRWEEVAEVSPRHTSCGLRDLVGTMSELHFFALRVQEKGRHRTKLSEILNGSRLLGLLLVTLLKLNLLCGHQRSHLRSEVLRLKCVSHIHPLCVEEKGDL